MSRSFGPPKIPASRDLGPRTPGKSHGAFGQERALLSCLKCEQAKKREDPEQLQVLRRSVKTVRREGFCSDLAVRVLCLREGAGEEFDPAVQGPPNPFQVQDDPFRRGEHVARFNLNRMAPGTGKYAASFQGGSEFESPRASRRPEFHNCPSALKERVAEGKHAFESCGGVARLLPHESL